MNHWLRPPVDFVQPEPLARLRCLVKGHVPWSRFNPHICRRCGRRFPKR